MKKIDRQIAQQKEAMLQWFNDLADRGIFTTDNYLNILSWNHWLEINSGLTYKEVFGNNLLQIYPELKQRRLDSFYEQALNGEVVLLSQRLHGYLLPMKPKIGNNFLTNMLQSVKIAPLTLDCGNIGTITVIEDVTERVVRETELQHQIEALKQTEFALLSTYSRLQHLLSSSPAIIYTRKFDRTQNITFVSNNVVAKLGYHPQEFTENPTFWSDRIHPDRVEEVSKRLSELLEKKSLILEYRFLHKDGNYRWVRDEMKLVLNLEGNVQEIMGVWYDTTEEKRVEEQIREQAALIDISTDAILVKDLNERILFWNKSAEHQYGWQAVEAIGNPTSQLLCESPTSQLEEAIATVLKKGWWHGELHQITKAGNKIIVESRWTLLRDRQEQPQSILVVNTDITEKKQLESQFLRIQRIESIGNLASGIAHDMNNILTPILASAQMLMKLDITPARRNNLLGMIETSAKRGASLVKQLMSFARGMEGKRAPIQIGHLILETKHIIQETFPKSIGLSVYISPSLCLVYGDPTQIEQVLMNLCVNARDAMPEGGTLSISAENVNIDPDYVRMNLDARVGSYIEIEVSDTGTGIPVQIIDRIFEPFFTTKEIGKGTGFGLSTVLGIVKSHGGFIKVNSQPGKGSEFKIYLPALEEDETLLEDEGEIPKGKGEWILVVDDEKYILEINKTTLEKFGYKVLIASDGREAIGLYARHKNKIKVVLMDMMMPYMDGLTTIQELQKINPAVKVIATSGLAESRSIEAATALGAKTFLPKPYTTQELLKSISNCLSE